MFSSATARAPAHRAAPCSSAPPVRAARPARRADPRARPARSAFAASTVRRSAAEQVQLPGGARAELILIVGIGDADAADAGDRDLADLADDRPLGRRLADALAVIGSVGREARPQAARLISRCASASWLRSTAARRSRLPRSDRSDQRVELGSLKRVHQRASSAGCSVTALSAGGVRLGSVRSRRCRGCRRLAGTCSARCGPMGRQLRHPGARSWVRGYRP